MNFPYRESTFDEIVEANKLTYGQVAKRLERMYKQGRLGVGRNSDNRHVYYRTGISSETLESAIK